MNDTRARIYQHIKSNPGVHFRELTRALDLATGQVQYHLARLDRVHSESVNGRTHYYTTSFDPWERHAIAFFQRETARDILVALMECETARPEEVADHLDIARSTLEHHLSSLTEHDIVEKRRSEGRVTLALCRPDSTVELLAAVDPTASDRLSDRFTRLLDRLFEGG
ncbi:ArsR family transcriptional regulator [Haloarcula taiwanensis]|uniref:ArsR family transcriptional regulator n=1 Tax=Haloarcula taiwanensis TaxID=1932004 RepID=A0A2H4ZWE3_9EURY|nr:MULTISPECIES: helix-turn-helix domain-containing protein [Haloarcula]AUG46806.1 ArsR family transcriptional regulator [Haloarcula taiwanensis]RLM37010.1 winged helix-turn-helix transcriptional regulator [Haloarcula sp. Atlit-120R]RLM44601.1 winged helix-turn-helix transcriptional regulator [Haloarcula sp. Atlit-47R]